MRKINQSNAIKIAFIICSIGSASAQPLPREKPVAVVLGRANARETKSAAL